MTTTTSSPGIPESHFPTQLDGYLAAVCRGDRQEAIDIALALLQTGLSAEAVVTDLLSRAQAEIGLGWQDGRWGVAMEHRASAITESVLQAVVHSALSAPGAVREGSRGRVVICCCESEWHVLPGRMAAEVLRLRGADVSFIGPSVPADELAGFFGHDLPTAVAITCSMPMSLVGAWHSISALRAMGMTIVCGGRGFGRGGSWGLALGADHWAPDYAAGADLLLSATGRPAPAPREPAGAAERIAEVSVLGREHWRLLEEANRVSSATWPTLRNSNGVIRETHEGLAATLRVVAAATLVSDLDLVTDYVSWCEAVLTVRDLPRALVPRAFEQILNVLPAELSCARAVARFGADACW